MGFGNAQQGETKSLSVTGSLGIAPAFLGRCEASSLDCIWMYLVTGVCKARCAIASPREPSACVFLWAIALNRAYCFEVFELA